MRKIKLILSEQHKNENIFTKSCRVSLFKVVITCCEVNIKILSLFIRKRFSMATVKSDQQWSCTGASILEDKINRGQELASDSVTVLTPDDFRAQLCATLILFYECILKVPVPADVLQPRSSSAASPENLLSPLLPPTLPRLLRPRPRQPMLMRPPVGPGSTLQRRRRTHRRMPRSKPRWRLAIRVVARQARGHSGQGYCQILNKRVCACNDLDQLPLIVHAMQCFQKLTKIGHRPPPPLAQIQSIVYLHVLP
jgi:hypothetical protein